VNLILRFDAWLVATVTRSTEKFIHTKWGQLFLSLSMVGPLTFIPTVWQAWTAENIDALRTMTWPSMVAINLSVLVAVCYNGDWRVRLSLLMWILLAFLVWLATILR